MSFKNSFKKKVDRPALALVCSDVQPQPATTAIEFENDPWKFVGRQAGLTASDHDNSSSNSNKAMSFKYLKWRKDELWDILYSIYCRFQLLFFFYWFSYLMSNFNPFCFTFQNYLLNWNNQKCLYYTIKKS